MPWERQSGSQEEYTEVCLLIRSICSMRDIHYHNSKRTVCKAGLQAGNLLLACYANESLMISSLVEFNQPFPAAELGFHQCLLKLHFVDTNQDVKKLIF